MLSQSQEQLTLTYVII